jgi:hypothetical protein
MRFMRYRWIFNLLLLIVLVVGLFIILRPPKNEGGTPTEEAIHLSNEELTLASFKKVDDFPLYVMTYYGDYGFDDYLKEGMATLQLPLLSPDYAWACTTFSASNPDGDLLLGRNFDWYDHPALLLFTDSPKAYASATMVDLHYLGFLMDQEPTDEAMQALFDTPFWTFDGMNEHGLAVGMMAVSRAEPHHDPDRATISSLEAIRLMLDYAKDVDEAVDLLGQYNIDFIGGPPLHYLIADRLGNSVAIEFIDGEMILIENEEPWQVSTNFLISIEEPRDANSSCWRYNTAFEVLGESLGNITAEEGMEILESVSQSNTIWSILYNQSTLEIVVSVGQDYRNLHPFTLESSIQN